MRHFKRVLFVVAAGVGYLLAIAVNLVIAALAIGVNVVGLALVLRAVGVV